MTPLLHTAAVALVLLGASFCLPSSVYADDPPEASETLYRVDVRDQPLLELIIVFSDVTGENFVLLDQEMADKRLTIYAPNPVTADEACELFVTALRLSGFTAQRSGSYWKIETFE